MGDVPGSAEKEVILLLHYVRKWQDWRKEQEQAKALRSSRESRSVLAEIGETGQLAQQATCLHAAANDISLPSRLSSLFRAGRKKEGKGENVCPFSIVLHLQVGVDPRGVDGGGNEVQTKDALEKGLFGGTGLRKIRRVVPKLHSISQERSNRRLFFRQTGGQRFRG